MLRSHRDIFGNLQKRSEHLWKCGDGSLTPLTWERLAGIPTITPLYLPTQFVINDQYQCVIQKTVSKKREQQGNSTL